MAKIYIENSKISTVHTILNHWNDGEKEPHFINIMFAMRGWRPFECGEAAEIHYGNETYIIERKK